MAVHFVLAAIILSPDACFTIVQAQITHTLHQVVIFGTPHQRTGCHCALSALHHSSFASAVDNIGFRRSNSVCKQACLAILIREAYICQLQPCGRSSQAFGNFYIAIKIVLCTLNSTIIVQLLSQVCKYGRGLLCLVHIKATVVSNQSNSRILRSVVDGDISTCDIGRVFCVMCIENIHVACIIANSRVLVSPGHIDITCRSCRITASEGFQSCFTITVIIVVPNCTVFNGSSNSVI